MNEEIQEKINNLSMLEQNIQQIAAQRQSFQTQIIEIDSALDELSDSKEAYKIIGSIMVKTDSSKLKEELQSKKSLIEIRIKALEKQEDAVKEKSKKLQEEIMLGLNQKEDKKEHPAKHKEKKKEE